MRMALRGNQRAIKGQSRGNQGAISAHLGVDEPGERRMPPLAHLRAGRSCGGPSEGDETRALKVMRGGQSRSLVVAIKIAIKGGRDHLRARGEEHLEERERPATISGMSGGHWVNERRSLGE